MIEETEVTIADVARYILEQTGQITTMKLQKLCYYSQVWHTYLLERKAFKEDFQAWSYGPVSYRLFDLHRGKYQISAEELPALSAQSLPEESIKIIDQVLMAYGNYSGTQLSDLSHQESPWVETRALVTASTQSPVIPIEKMYEFAAAQNARN